MKQIELKSLAKINLGLDVLGRRENGLLINWKRKKQR